MEQPVKSTAKTVADSYESTNVAPSNGPIMKAIPTAIPNCPTLAARSDEDEDDDEDDVTVSVSLCFVCNQSIYE